MNEENGMRREARAGVPGLEPERGRGGVSRAALGCAALVAAWLMAAGVYFAVQRFAGRGDKTEKPDAESPALTSSRDLVRRMPPPPPVPEVAPILKADPKPEPEPAPEPVRVERAKRIEPAVLGGTPPQLASEQQSAPGEKREKTVTERQLASAMMAETGVQTRGNGIPPGASDAPGGERSGRYADGGSLGENLKPIRIEKGSALRMKNRSYVLPQGAFINCIMETALDTSVPGMASCRIPEHVFSMDGRTLLIERGSRAFGEYRGAVANGLARIFLLWTRIETPHGVIVDLNSPATDGLGRAGLAGEVDNHWWQRFGSALLFSLVQDGFDFAMTKANKSSETNYYGNTQSGMSELIREAMRWAGNIPPTLHVNQGAGVGIFVARPIDMSGVYRLESGTELP